MDRCPLCRAMLNGADRCRRCRAELGMVQKTEREGQALVGAAMHQLALGDAMAAERSVRRALALHATPEAQALLWRLTSSAP